MSTPKPADPVNVPASAQTTWVGSRIVRAEDLGLAVSAVDLLAQARAQAQAIVDQAHQRAAVIHAEAATASAAEVARGYAAGMLRAEKDFAIKMAQSNASDAKQFAGQEERMCLLVTRTLEKVLAESQNDERFFSGVMTRVLRAAREEKYLTVRVNAEQREPAERAIQDLLKRAAAPNFIEVLGEADLRRGSCIVESAHGVIDASLDTQLDNIREALLGAWRSDRG
jgi:type III secretion protein L